MKASAVTVGSERRRAVPRLGEPRWPPAVALIVFIGLNIGLRIWLPSAATVRVVWLVPAIEALLVVVIVFVVIAAISRAMRLFRTPGVAPVTSLLGG